MQLSVGLELDIAGEGRRLASTAPHGAEQDTAE